MKDLKWLENEVRCEYNHNQKRLIHTSNEKYAARTFAFSRALNLINQLEVETLSQDWLEEHTEGGWGEYVRIEDLEKLLVPKQTDADQAYKDGYEKGKEHGYKNGYSVGFSDSTHDSNEPLGNPQQLKSTASEMERVRIPQFVADYIDDRKEINFPFYQAIRIVRRNSKFEDSELRNWLWTNTNQETFARAWLDGFTVEEEQKYYVMNNNNRMMLCRKMDGKTITEADPFKLEAMYEGEKESHRLTEQEIKDYDPRYMAFAKPVEEVD